MKHEGIVSVKITDSTGRVVTADKAAKYGWVSRARKFAKIKIGRAHV